ncbi:hypothetical protein [Vibrio cionasavignyae]|uniref:hypothetical protein n=1 Tax=Vibrio cionasavignyae TaxID=2910252 RepID=UPI003D0EE44C
MILPTPTDVAFSIYRDKQLYWFEYDYERIDYLTSSPSEFISLSSDDSKKYSVSIKQNEMVRRFYHRVLAKVGRKRSLLFLLCRLRVLQRRVPIEHFGYMTPRKPSTLRVCSRALSIESANKLFPALLGSNPLSSIFSAVRNDFEVKLSIDVSTVYHVVGVEFHPINRVENRWSDLFHIVSEVMSLPEGWIQSIQSVANTSYQLAPDNVDYVSMLALSHVKLSLKHGEVTNIKSYTKVSSFRLFSGATK